MTTTAGLPTIAVTINGKGPFSIGFDTGAPGGPRLTERLAKELGLTAVGEARASDPSGKNPIPVKLYRLDTADFGPIRVGGWVATAEAARSGRLGSLDGLVGLDAFAGYVVTLDFARKNVSIERGALPVPDGKGIFAYDGPIPSVPLLIEGQTIRAHLDTGNVRFPLIVPEAVALKLAQKSKARSIGQGRTVSNTVDMFAVPLTENAKVGAVSLAVGEVAFPSIIPMANIGALALDGQVLRVDPANRRVMIESVQDLRQPVASIT
jgi:hypothetical protein